MGAKKKRPAGKRKLAKVSAAKLSNKRLNKLAKQGKLKTRLGNKGKLLRLLKERTQPGSQELRETDYARSAKETIAEWKQQQQRLEGVASAEEVEPLEEADLKYFSTTGQDLGFLSSIVDSGDDDSSRKSKKRKRQEEAAEAEYEQLPRKQSGKKQKEVKALLPIKSKEGVVPQEVEVEAEVPQEADTGKQEEPQETTPLPAVSTAQLYALRQQRLAQRKQRIALLASAVVENPQEATRKLKELRLMLTENEPDIYITVRKLAVASLLTVFKDIIPDYRIRLATEQEKQQQAKKETKTLRDFEESLLTNYQHYLEYLETVVKGKPPKGKSHKKGKINGQQMPPSAMLAMRELCIKCLCELLVTHPHFNFANNIVTVLVPFMDHHNEKLSVMVCGYMRKVFREDKMGEVSLEIVRLAGRVIKNKGFDVHPRMLQAFLSLKIKEVQWDQDTEAKKPGMTRQERFLKTSRKERRRKKQMDELEKELQNAAAMDDKKKKIRTHTSIVEAVFLTYFRILKQARDSPLLSTVLEGLAKFAHAINIDFFDDLFAVLTELVESQELSYKESLHCIQTAFTILTGQGSALNIDPLRFYKHLYSNLFHLHAGDTSEDLPIVLQCLDLMISKRRKQVSHNRILAFIKRLSTLALQLMSHGTLSVLAAVKSLLQADPRSDILFDLESQGSGVYLADLQDPEHCNPHSTALWEMHLLKRHFHPVVRRYADHVCAQAPSQGAKQLSLELSRKSAVELFHEYNPAGMDLKPPLKYVKRKNPKKQTRTDEFLQADVAVKVEQTLSAVQPLTAISVKPTAVHSSKLSETEKKAKHKKHTEKQRKKLRTS